MKPAQVRRALNVRDLAANGSARAIREAADVTLREAARILDVASSTLSRWETGTARPGIDDALKWAELLDVLEECAATRGAYPSDARKVAEPSGV